MFFLGMVAMFPSDGQSILRHIASVRFQWQAHGNTITTKLKNYN